MSASLLQCPSCGKDDFDTEYFKHETECWEYITCHGCDELVASSSYCIQDGDERLPVMEQIEHDLAASDFGSCSQCDQDASGDRNAEVIDLTDIYLTEDEQMMCIESMDYHQALKNSCSAFNFAEQHGVINVAARPATLDNGELSRETLKQARELFRQNLACSCASPDSEILPVDGINDVFCCSVCSLVHGVDDSVNYYDLLEKGDYVVEACVECGNTDPNLFCLDSGSTPDSVILRCMKCSAATRETDGESFDAAVDSEEETLLDKCIKEWIQYECKCANAVSELQKIVIDSSSETSTVFVKCWVCLREDMIKLDFKPKFCTCSTGDNVEVRYDEFGYVSKLFCSRCRAEMDCGPPTAADVPAAGDGTSLGRVRIFAVSEIRVGDHLAMHQWLAYWHHMIVIEVNGTQIHVIHYNRPLGCNLLNKGV